LYAQREPGPLSLTDSVNVVDLHGCEVVGKPVTYKMGRLLVAEKGRKSYSQVHMSGIVMLLGVTKEASRMGPVAHIYSLSALRHLPLHQLLP